MGGLFESLSGAAALRAEGESAQNIAEFNAAVAEQGAEAERLRAAFAQKRQAKTAAAIKSALTAKIGAAGGIGSPVAADLAAEQAAELELANLLIGFEGEALAGRAMSQAELDRLSGKLAKQKGKAAARQANIQFALQLASFVPVFGGGGGSPPAQGSVAPPNFGSPGTGGGLPGLGGRRFLTGFA